MKLLSLFILLSCASIDTEAWYDVGVAFEKQKWRLCTKERDGIERHLKGLCYIGKECRNRRFRSSICRPKPYFCGWDNKECLSRQAYANKFLMRKGR